ncbi:class I SAM-dependent methyltransferase [Candidatus Methylocalor cossyra]|uniref:Methionine biosynthesis protein MetW n=1 Tax=Candidatus Methylocalor cossyra TaxID=3108543 RepID=A0ABP1C7I0_9GAMM
MSFLYRSSWLYHTVLAGAYGRHKLDRFRAVAQWIPEGSKVLDVCCGDGRLAEYLPPSVDYRGLDRSRALVRAARRLGRRVDAFDLRTDALPRAEIVVCQISLYQFYPHVESVLARLFEAAEQRLIITESVRCLAQSRWPWLAALGAWGMRVEGMGDSRFRFTPHSLQELFRPYRERLRHWGAISAGRDWLFVLEK